MHIENPPAPEGGVKPPKPLGFKAYGSTPHLIGSRLGPGDYSLKREQSELFTGSRKRLGGRPKKDRIIVTEKVDGSCVSVAKASGDILALQRAGYLAATSPYALHHAFDRWVSARSTLFREMLSDGERIVGEWMHTAMGTRYEIEDPEKLLIGFALFDGTRRLPYDAFVERCEKHGIQMAHLIADGAGISAEEAMSLLGPHGFHGALDGVEGAVWVMETNGEFNAIAKFVKSDKIDGKYMSGITEEPDVINYVGPEF